VIKTGAWTVTNEKTGEWRTFRVTKERSKRVKFAPGARLIELLTGPDNRNSFTSFGFVNGDEIKVWQSKRGNGKPSAYDWYAPMVAGLLGGKAALDRDWAAKGYVIKGEARCCRCGRALTTPESIEAGIGPVCSGRK
jgi:hypothetical protein